MSDACVYCLKKISISSSFRGAGDGFGNKFAHDDCWMREEIKRLEAQLKIREKQLKISVQTLEKLSTQFKSVKMHQERLLIRGQDLESASKNWEEAANVDFIDFGIIEEALRKIEELSK